MELSWIDISIVFIDLVQLFFLGFLPVLKSLKNLESYFLGGNKSNGTISMSNASECSSISGTQGDVTLPLYD